MPSVAPDADGLARFAEVAERALALAELIGPQEGDEDATVYPPGVERCWECGYRVGPVTRMCAACHFRGWLWLA